MKIEQDINLVNPISFMLKKKVVLLLNKMKETIMCLNFIVQIKISEESLKISPTFSLIFLLFICFCFKPNLICFFSKNLSILPQLNSITESLLIFLEFCKKLFMCMIFDNISQFEVNKRFSIIFKQISIIPKKVIKQFKVTSSCKPIEQINQHKLKIMIFSITRNIKRILKKPNTSLLMNK